MCSTFGYVHIGSVSKNEKRTPHILIILTRKYPLRGYFLGVLTHTTAWDRLWGGDETLKCGFKIEYT